MKINSITLTNIGPYVGENRFSISTNGDKNIILIGGKNGSGKTTLLKAFKIGLFGCFSYGYRTENSSYFKEIDTILSNKATDNDYRISIDFEYIEKHIQYNYKIIRSWSFTESGLLTENVSIEQDGNALNTSTVNELINKIRSMTSPALINSFIYDGEKIGSIIESGNVASYLQDVFNSVFSIDILNQFQKDLFVYLNTKDDNTSEEEYELSNYVNRINAFKAEEKAGIHYVLAVNQQINDIKVQIYALQKEFEKIGGLSKDGCIRLQNIMKALEKTSESNNKALREFYDEFLPLYIVRKNLLRVANQAEKELPLLYREMLCKIQNYLGEDLSVIIDKLGCKDGSNTLFDLSEDDIAEIRKTVSYVNKKRKEIDIIISNKASLSQQIISIRDSLATNNEVERINSIIEQIEQLQSRMTTLVSDVVDKQTYISDIQKEKNVLINKYNELFDKQKKEKQIGNSFLLCSKTISVCEQLKEHLRKSKIEQISNTCCSIFNATIRKESYISNIVIDDNFNLKLYSDGKEISIEYLSAGEMQLLISCIIWSIFKVSGRRELFVFDTPLARLDDENRIAFSKNIIATISEQVIILSTDSEFMGDSYKVIEGNIAAEYLLEYDDKTKSTQAKAAYFGEKKK